jgi:hypothetical protein
MVEITSGTVYLGGSDVDATHGFLMSANTPYVFNIYSNDIPYAFSTGTPVVYVLVGRQ